MPLQYRHEGFESLQLDPFRHAQPSSAEKLDLDASIRCRSSLSARLWHSNLDQLRHRRSRRLQSLSPVVDPMAPHLVLCGEVLDTQPRASKLTQDPPRLHWRPLRRASEVRPLCLSCLSHPRAVPESSALGQAPLVDGLRYIRDAELFDDNAAAGIGL